MGAGGGSIHHEPMAEWSVPRPCSPIASSSTRRREYLARLLDVALYLRGEVGDRVGTVEADLVAQTGDEFNDALLPVEVAIEVEEVGLEERGTGVDVEGRSPSHRDGCRVTL